jgi:hypothetical protein
MDDIDNKSNQRAEFYYKTPNGGEVRMVASEQFIERWFDRLDDRRIEKLEAVLARPALSKFETKIPSVEPSVEDTADGGTADYRSKSSRRKPQNSSARTGRLGGFEPVKLNLDEAQQRQLYTEYQGKIFSTAGEKAAVAMLIGEQLLDKKVFGYNEVYTIMNLGGEKSMPKALDVLCGDLVRDNWIQREADGSFSLKFLARDHIGKMSLKPLQS